MNNEHLFIIVYILVAAFFLGWNILTSRTKVERLDFVMAAIWPFELGLLIYVLWTEDRKALLLFIRDVAGAGIVGALIALALFLAVVWR